MFNGSTNFRKVKRLKININDFRAGLITKDSIIGNSKNSLSNAENIEFTGKMGFKKRITAVRLGTDSPTGIVSGIGYSPAQISSANYFRTKNGDFQKLVGSTWTNVGTVQNISIVGNYYDIFPHYSIGNASTGTGSSGNATQGNERWIKNSGGMQINKFVGDYITINGETKLITSNTEDQIFIDGIFETVPSTESYQINGITDAIYIAGIQDLYSFDGINGFRNLSTSIIKPRRAVVEHNRLWFVKMEGNTPRVYFSELGIGDYFSSLNYIELKNLGTVKSIKNIQGKIIVYFDTARVDITGDTPDSFSVKYVFTHKGSVAGGSVANGNNMQFFLSKEGIEILNAIDNFTIKEGVSQSDRIRFHSDVRERAHGVVANDKYYLSINTDVYIYDIIRSLELGYAVFTTAKYTEASQSGSPSVGEWTCAKDCNGLATFGQGGNVYQIFPFDSNNTENDNIVTTVETSRINNGDEKTKKIFKRVKIAFTECARNTTFKLYVSIDGGPYTLEINTNLFEFEVFLSNMGRDIRLKIEVSQSGSGDGFYEFLGGEIYYQPLNKY